RLRQEPALGEAIRRELGELAGVIEVHVRPVTGTVVVRYETNGRDPLPDSLASVTRLPEAGPGGVPAQTPGPSVGLTAAESICREWGRLDEGLKRNSEGALDINAAVPLFFVSLGVWQLLTAP